MPGLGPGIHVFLVCFRPACSLASQARRGYPPRMGKRKFPAVKNLIKQVEATAAPGGANALDTLAISITGAIQSSSDPYAMAGLLVEAIAATIASRVPPEEQQSLTLAVIELLQDRLSAHNVI
jgi:hypothetical protein